MTKNLLVLAGALCVACTPQPAVAPLAPVEEVHVVPDDSPIALRSSVVADEFFWLRAKLLEGEAPPPFRAAYSAMHDLRADLGSDASAWEDLEVPLGTLSRAHELGAAYGALPELTDVDGRSIALRAEAMRVARTLEATETEYLRGPYREHADAIARAAKDLSARLLPNESAILKSIESDMNLPGVDRAIIVTLVGDAPYPAFFAADERGKQIATFVRVRGLDGTALVETVLQASLHAIDEITVKTPTAMNMLRGALAHRGIDEADPNIEMIVNTLTFAEAASLVRRFVDKAHKPMGEGGFYTLYPPAMSIVAAWDRHLDGEPLESTMDAIASAVSTPTEPAD
ncbi:MAG TPA: hypothetical protein VIF62_39410 [Labilithrix sp.]